MPGMTDGLVYIIVPFKDVSVDIGKPATLGDLNINTVRPKDPSLSVFTKRKETYKRYSDSNPVPADKLCEAGFFYEGIGDKVKCFWCDGALEMWSKGDEPWMEHAKWYPGCTYVQQTKGLDFIRKARATMTPDNVHTADTLTYNKGDVAFLGIPFHVAEKLGFKYCEALGYDRQHIIAVYSANNDEEFEEDIARMVGIVQDLQEGDRSSLEYFEEEQKQKRGAASQSSHRSLVGILCDPGEPTNNECDVVIKGLRCKECKKQLAGAIVLPCGCFCLCQECGRGNLPTKCPACSNVVKGACRTFAS
ncbi:BIRC7 [Bugula neritina]|uniref:BIRC7 n=1 Tax=Bugula neritina TaxID=10212 RepID=A0A7J7KQD5_BUGNE|nr:BIRC7 [Bugula neritina]